MLPNNVSIAGITYEIKEEEDMESRYNHLGQILYTRGIINIEKGMSEERKEQIFVHELLHGIFYEAGIEDQDEDMINRVSKILYPVLKENRFEFGG